ncbi:hypothetical protein [Kitasatospora sp. NPDC090091]|uniref:hypothetical protein n=1 Tax=Kitasatospora sp. NPDC090091 TaxID=3364081 RepID=UPI003813C5BD
MSTWWERRRSARLTELAYALELFGAEPIEDPGVGELARSAEDLAAEYRASDRGPVVHRTGDLLEQAAAVLHTADRFRGALIPAVNHHLRCAATVLANARTCLQTSAFPIADAAALPPGDGPGRGSTPGEPRDVKASYGPARPGPSAPS